MVTINWVLRANATSCILFGLLFLILPSTIALFLSTSKPAPTELIFILGAGLIINGIHLLWEASKQAPTKLMILYFSAGDLLWVLATFILLVTETWISTRQGVVSALLVAALVGTLGVLQFNIARKLNQA